MNLRKIQDARDPRFIPRPGQKTEKFLISRRRQWRKFWLGPLVVAFPVTLVTGKVHLGAGVDATQPDTVSCHGLRCLRDLNRWRAMSVPACVISLHAPIRIIGLIARLSSHHPSFACQAPSGIVPKIPLLGSRQSLHTPPIIAACGGGLLSGRRRCRIRINQWHAFSCCPGSEVAR